MSSTMRQRRPAGASSSSSSSSSGSASKARANTGVFKIYYLCKARGNQGGPVALVNRGRVVMPNQRNDHMSHVAHLALIVIVLIISSVANEVQCSEQDAQILQPLANLAHSFINTITLGVPLEFNLTATDVVKSFAMLSWRTGFPLTMPSDFMQKSQDFYNTIRARVDEADVGLVQRKSLADLGEDLHLIVDSIVDEVRASPDGVYTDYTKTRVNGTSLEDACVAVGIQLKAYTVDLKHYRNIAGMVLGVPLMPQVASTVVGVASLAPNLESVQNLTSAVVFMPVNQLPGAMNTVSTISNSAMDSLSQTYLPSGLVSSLSSLIGVGSSAAAA